MDYGHKQSDKMLKDLEKRLQKEYAQAEKEVSQKLSDYLKAFERKDQHKVEQLKAGEITEKEYLDWRKGQILMGERWSEMRDTLAQDLHNTNKIAQDMVKTHTQDVYALNHNYGTYEAEKGAMVDTSYTLYDRSTVERLMKDNPDLLPPPGKKTAQRIAEGKDVLWNKQQIQSVMLQGVLQGESIPKLAKRLAEEVGDKNKSASIRNARTMTTGAENAGREDSYHRAEDMGIDMEQMWVATLDDRTRHEHRMLDGQTRPVGEPFEVDGMKIMYPGDPSADPSLVYNCRCTLVAVVKHSRLDTEGLEGMTRNSKLGDMSYDTWLGKHEQAAEAETEAERVEVDFGNASKVLGDKSEDAKLFAERMSGADVEKFNAIFQKAEYQQSTTGSHYDPTNNKIEIDANSRAEVVFHESTHWLDFNQKYTITDDWGRYNRIYDDDGNLISKEWIPNIVTIKENASFCEYISSKWDAYEIGSDITKAGEDLRNFVKKIGMSDTYGYNRSTDDVKKDFDAVKAYLNGKGIDRTDPDFVHLSDFMSAMSYDATLGSLVTGGHDYSYWVRDNSNRVTEITAGYNLLRALGREDMLEIERDLAPNLMQMIEEEWKKIW